VTPCWQAARKGATKHARAPASAWSWAMTSWTASNLWWSRGTSSGTWRRAAPLTDVLDRVASANAYIGAEPIVRALEKGATVVVTGRSTDTALTYGPMMHEFGWAPDDWDRWPPGSWPATSTSAAPRPAAATA
jgi:hypothetical protein